MLTALNIKKTAIVKLSVCFSRIFNELQYFVESI